jgi:hypothetical protein
MYLILLTHTRVVVIDMIWHSLPIQLGHLNAYNTSLCVLDTHAA